MEKEKTALHLKHQTPAVEQLLPNYKMNCTQPNCASTFSNAGNLYLHLRKHHKLEATEASKFAETNVVYHCPEQACQYNAGQQTAKSFKTLKYLRQHYQKMHCAKCVMCDRCAQTFITAGQLQTHAETVCGKSFICSVCGWAYNSMEALLTHVKRKGHAKEQTPAKPKLVTSAKLAIPKLPTKRKAPALQHKQTQIQADEAAPPAKQALCLSVAAVQTDPSPLLASASIFSNDLDDINFILRDIETQTEFPWHSSNSSNAGFLEQMLAQSTHMHTQTCDDLLSELGLADIQTQTNWSASAGMTSMDDAEKQQYTSIATSTNCAHDELLVSTETQTSFSECLAACNASTECSNAFSNSLYITQYTQTCDPLLDDIFGGAQDADYSYQSTYTQT